MLQAYLFVFVVAAVASLITWGLGLVVGVLLAVEVAKQGRERGLTLHFPMLVAAGYSGYVIWHMGYSGPGRWPQPPRARSLPTLGETISISETVSHGGTSLAVIATILVVGVGLALVAPRAGDRISSSTPRRASTTTSPSMTRSSPRPTGWTPAASSSACRAGPGRLPGDPLREGRHRDPRHRELDLPGPDLPAGAQPVELIALTKNAASNVGEILLQFPLYAGIMGIMNTRA